jgi:hypothetical protein
LKGFFFKDLRLYKIAVSLQFKALAAALIEGYSTEVPVSVLVTSTSIPLEITLDFEVAALILALISSERLIQAAFNLSFVSSEVS